MIAAYLHQMDECYRELPVRNRRAQLVVAYFTVLAEFKANRSKQLDGIETRTLQGALNTLIPKYHYDFIDAWHTQWLTNKLLS